MQKSSIPTTFHLKQNYQYFIHQLAQKNHQQIQPILQEYNLQVLQQRQQMEQGKNKSYY